MKPLHSLRAIRWALPLFSCIAWSQVPGPNINIVSNDPYNQKQVEVDAAANPLNPNHIVAGFIDYQVVVNENPALEPESSAWCGFSFSVNGRTWKNTLVPGFPADTSTAGKSSPIFGNSRCGDPSIAWDTSGHVFYEGLAEAASGATTLFVARFTDPDDGSGGLLYDYTAVISSGNPSATGQVVDKPSLLFVPSPAAGSNPSAGTLFACGTIFDGTLGGKFRNKVVCSVSSDGVNFSKVNQTKVNGSVNTNNGTALAPAPNGGAYLFWRAFLGTENGYWFVKLDQSGNASAPVQAVGPANFYPYDVPSLGDLARSNAFPTVATDAAGRILLAFQAYSDPTGAMAAPGPTNTPRIFLTWSSNAGSSWSTPRAVDYGPHVNTFQFMPRLAVAGGGAFDILYYDARNDGRPLNSISGGYFPNGKDRRYDVRIIQGQFDASGNISFNPSAQVSQYPIGRNGLISDRLPNCSPTGSCPSLLYPNLPIAGGGTVPFIGDYIALAPGVSLVRNPLSNSLPAWRFANQSQDPVKFLAFFTSTQDVGFPLNASGVPDINGNWAQFVPAGFASCANPKTRDSNIYFSAISPGIVASWSGPSKTLLGPNGTIPAQFTVSVENRSNQNGYFRLTILDSAPTEDWSFLQTPPAPAPILNDKNSVDTQILRNSSATLPVYYRFRSSTNGAPASPVQVLVQQIDQIGGNVISNGLKTSVTYNLTAATLQLDNLQVDNLQLDNQQINLQVDNLQIDNLQVDNASPSNLQVDNLQVDNLQIDNTLIPDQDVTWTVTGTGSAPTPGNVITNLVNGQDLLNQNYQFQLLIYQTQNNPGVNGCSLVQVPTDVVISNIAITSPTVQNLQVDNQTVNNLQVDNSAISDPQGSNATFVLNKGDKLKITLRSFKKPGSSAFQPNSLNVGQAVFSQAANPDGTRSASFFDFTPPVITPVVVGTQGKNGWYVSAVTVNWLVSDPQSGIVSQTGCATTSLTSDTNATTLNCSATNGAGLTASSSVTIMIDTTPPTITAALSPLSPAATGWYNSQTGRPTVTFTCTDTGSGIAAGTCPGVVNVQDGKDQTISSGAVTDMAGNVAVPVSIAHINVDATPPVITAGVSPAAAATGWYNLATGRPTVSFTCSDATSGLAAACPGPITVTTDGAGQTVTGTVNDIAGNTGTAIVSGLNVDQKAPTITITTPAGNASYVLNASVAANYSCADGSPGSGIATCTGPVSSGSKLNTATVGPNSFTVTATDVAGNTASATNTYAVVYNFTLTPPKSPAQLNSAVPLIWTLTDANGAFITDVSSLVSLQSVYNGQSTSCAPSLAGTAANLYSPATGATGGSNLRNTANGFQFNWNTTTTSTTGAGCYTIVFQLKDNAGGPPGFAVLDPSRLKMTAVQLK